MSLPIGRTCQEFQQLAMSRRGFIHAGSLGMAGLTLPALLQHEARATSLGKKVNRETSVIILWMRGGPSQHDMWDPKPDAPVEVRGEFKTISTSVPGIQVTELLPLTAKMMHKWSIVRSLSHRKEDGDVGHSAGDQICFTGYPSGPSPDMNVMPSCGAYAAKQLQHLNPAMPAYVMVPRNVPGTGSAWLGKTCSAFETQADPAQSGPFKIPNFSFADGVTPQRLGERTELLTRFNNPKLSEGQESFKEFQNQALGILSSGKARAAFDLDAEPQSLRERYGFMPAFDPMDPERCGSPNWAQRMLLSRRLVEAGVRLVTVDLRWWDFHKQGFDSQRRGFLPRWDRAYSAFIEDLEARGLLESTLVVAWGEFGRTPVVNKNAGRDHWPSVMSAALAGGGVVGGRVVGSSDAKGAYPKDNRKIPHDVLATIYRHLGMDTKAHYTDPTGRPFPVLSLGDPIDELF
ncbi:MAG: DUF1501 domain-containing protein [Gemmataceae bacterium]|nr:DUF1501 domain-containing protein [Gemmataceae bacterium]